MTGLDLAPKLLEPRDAPTPRKRESTSSGSKATLSSCRSPSPASTACSRRLGTCAEFPLLWGTEEHERRERVIAIWRDVNEADDGTLRLPQEYLLSIVNVRA